MCQEIATIEKNIILPQRYAGSLLFVNKFRQFNCCMEHTCVAVYHAECVRMPVAEKLSPDDVRVEPHYLQIFGVVLLVERHGAAFVVVHPWWCVADYVHLTIVVE